MSSSGRPECPNEHCDGNLHREFKTGLKQSTAQTMRLAGLALIFGPFVFGAPFIIDFVARRTGGTVAMIGTLVLLATSIAAGIVLLRKRAAGLAQKSEQQRCNKCGAVFPLGVG